MFNNKDTANLLIELGTEEMPPFLNKLAESLANNFCRQLKVQGFSFEEHQVFASPRRLAFIVYDLANKQENYLVEKKGPKVADAYDKEGNPTAAALGFANSCKAELTELSTISLNDEEYLFFETEVQGKSIQEMLQSMLEEAIKNLPSQKTMRWANLNKSFIRPVHWLVALYDKEILNFELFSKKSSNLTFGHRFAAPQAIKLGLAEDYEKILEKNLCIADFAKRKTMILKALEQRASAAQAKLSLNKDLLEEVTNLVDWPFVLTAEFSEDFLTAPQEVLIAAIEGHQKCFPLFNEHNKLINKFLLVSNAKTEDYSNIIHGNQKVMHARLSDAKFFYDSDLATNPINQTEKLKQVVFQKQLGSLFDKTTRTKTIATKLAQELQFVDFINTSERAAEVYKTDLCSGVVGEFPELQGIMGSYYATANKENQLVAQAIKESYMPLNATAPLPVSNTGIVLSLADKLDTLYGIFAQGMAPTGDKDPFALRRAAIASIRILVEHKLNITLPKFINIATVGFTNSKLIKDTVEQELLTFFIERFKAMYKDTFNLDILSAALNTGDLCLFNLHERMLALLNFVSTEEAISLSASNKRINNILSKNAASVTDKQNNEVNPSLLEDPEEKALYAKMLSLQSKINTLVAQRSFRQALVELASLKDEVEQFFANVLVIAEDDEIKQNRLNLLQSLQSMIIKIADISCL